MKKENIEDFDIEKFNEDEAAKAPSLVKDEDETKSTIDKFNEDAKKEEEAKEAQKIYKRTIQYSEDMDLVLKVGGVANFILDAKFDEYLKRAKMHRRGRELTQLYLLLELEIKHNSGKLNEQIVDDIIDHQIDFNKEIRKEDIFTILECFEYMLDKLSIPQAQRIVFNRLFLAKESLVTL